MNYRETTLFFPQGTTKKRERSIKIRFIYILFQQPCDPVKTSLSFSPLSSLFFLFRLSFSSFDKCVKEAAPFEREQRERTSSPSFLVYFPQ